MAILYWNVKGLGCSRKNASIKEILRKSKADIIMIQEIKKESIDRK